MQDESLALERKQGKIKNSTFILRLVWESESQQWCIVVKPADGGPALVFADLELAFLYVARFYPDIE